MRLPGSGSSSGAKKPASMVSAVSLTSSPSQSSTRNAVMNNWYVSPYIFVKVYAGPL